MRDIWGTLTAVAGRVVYFQSHRVDVFVWRIGLETYALTYTMTYRPCIMGPCDMF